MYHCNTLHKKMYSVWPAKTQCLQKLISAPLKTERPTSPQTIFLNPYFCLVLFSKVHIWWNSFNVAKFPLCFICARRSVVLRFATRGRPKNIVFTQLHRSEASIIHLGNTDHYSYLALILMVKQKTNLIKCFPHVTGASTCIGSKSEMEIYTHPTPLKAEA